MKQPVELKHRLALGIKNPPKTAGCVCSVTHKPLALGMSVLCWEEGMPRLCGGSEGATWPQQPQVQGAEQRPRARDGYARKLPGPLLKWPLPVLGVTGIWEVRGKHG